MKQIIKIYQNIIISGISKININKICHKITIISHNFKINKISSSKIIEIIQIILNNIHNTTTVIIIITINNSSNNIKIMLQFSISNQNKQTIIIILTINNNGKMKVMASIKILIIIIICSN